MRDRAVTLRAGGTVGRGSGCWRGAWLSPMLSSNDHYWCNRTACTRRIRVLKVAWAQRHRSRIWTGPLLNFAGGMRCFGSLMGSVVGVAELLAGGDAVSDELLEFLDVGEAPRSFARPDELALRANVEDASRPRDEREFANVVLERCEQLLRHPGGAEKPAALRT